MAGHTSWGSKQAAPPGEPTLNSINTPTGQAAHRNAGGCTHQCACQAQQALVDGAAGGGLEQNHHNGHLPQPSVTSRAAEAAVRAAAAAELQSSSHASAGDLGTADGAGCLLVCRFLAGPPRDTSASLATANLPPRTAGP